MRPTITLSFAPEITHDQAKKMVQAFEDFYKACGGKGFEVSFEEYLELTARSVHETDPPGDALVIEFENYDTPLQVDKRLLRRRGLFDLHPGDRLLVQGKSGDDIVSLSSVRSIGAVKDIWRA